MITDPYRKNTTTYNILNKTEKVQLTGVTGKYIDYTYAADGKVLRKRVYDNSVLTTTTDYVDGFVYTNTTLNYLPMSEGRVVNNTGTLSPEYIISDHQGNARVSFKDNGSGAVDILQENSFYAFGKAMAVSAVTIPVNPNKNLYNGGSELQSELGITDVYQTFYRNYDPNLGRFLGVDPLAEATDYLTVYHYSGNNPVMFNDPLGDLRNTYGKRIYYSAVPPSGTSQTNPEGWAAWDYQNGVIDTYRFGEIIGYYKGKRDREERTGEISLYDEKGGGLFDLAEFARFLNSASKIRITKSGLEVWYQESYETENPDYTPGKSTTPKIININSRKETIDFSVLRELMSVLPNDVVSLGIGGAGVVGFWGNSNYYNLVSINKGPDAGLYYMNTISNQRYGLQVDLSVNLAVGWYIAPGYPSLESFKGTGWELGGDFALGVNLWTSQSGLIPTWAGFSVGFGPSIGISFGITNTIPEKLLFKY